MVKQTSTHRQRQIHNSPPYIQNPKIYTQQGTKRLSVCKFRRSLVGQEKAWPSSIIHIIKLVSMVDERVFNPQLPPGPALVASGHRRPLTASKTASPHSPVPLPPWPIWPSAMFMESCDSTGRKPVIGCAVSTRILQETRC